MNIGSASAPAAVSGAVSGGNGVKAAAAVTLQKKAEDINAEIATKLIASATGLGQRIDVKG